MNNGFKNSWLALRLLVLVVALYLIISTVYISQTTGQLKVTSSDKTALLVVSQSDHEAKIIGTGQTKIHLKPGVYEVSANTTTTQAYAAVTITKKLTTTRLLTLTNTPKLPSPASINFVGIDEFISQGLTTTQVSSLKQAFFDYNQKTKEVDIINNSLVPGPHNPNVDTSFSTNFSVGIDSKPYKAKITYSDITRVRLFLYDTVTGSQVFDSGS